MASENCSNVQKVDSSNLPAQLAQDTPHNWQSSKGTVSDRLRFLFNNPTLSDVSFLVGRPPDQQKIRAHKFVLSMGSAVFDAMFHSIISNTEDPIELPDVEPQALLSLLRFLYTDEVQVGPETVMTILYTAKKYAVPSLERGCVCFLRRNLSHENAFMLLAQARLFDESELASLCLDTIDKTTADALSADGFAEIDHSTLCLILERNSLRIRESQLFAAVVRWADAACRRCDLPSTPDNQRCQLGDAIFLIRFPLMNVEEFAAGPAQSGLLSDREVVQLFLYFTTNPKPLLPFNATPRSCLMRVELCASRFKQIETRWGYSGTSDKVIFSVDKRVFVVGFGIFGSTHGPNDYEAAFSLINAKTHEVLSVNETKVLCDGSDSTCRLVFREPVEVQPDLKYVASVALKGPDSFYGTLGTRVVCVDCGGTVGKVTFTFDAPPGNSNGTTVEDGQIPEIIFYV